MYEFSQIDMGLMLKAINFYTEVGYELLAVPMVVDKECSDKTKPSGVYNIHHNDTGVYVASAEQSFLQLHKEGKLKNNHKYMAVTPCIRPDELDTTHLHVFLKLELIHTGKYDEYLSIIKDAFNFFSTETNNLQVIDTEIGTDIYLNNIEIGSYGTREFLDGTPYEYGTGLALPRFSYAKSLPRDNVVIQVRGNGEVVKSVNGSTLKEIVGRSLRASFALAEINVSDVSWGEN
jgi:hypothetical protein